jgi:hypothetical protein
MSDGCDGCKRLGAADAPTVVLLTGRTVCTWCPGWLAETRDREVEARSILRMADKPTRVAHLARREAEFGSEYRRRLEATILGLWERRRAAAAASSGGS